MLIYSGDDRVDKKLMTQGSRKWEGNHLSHEEDSRVGSSAPADGP